MALAQSLKALLPVSKTFVISDFTEVKPMQYRNAYSPMLVTDLGIVTEVKFSQYENAFFPMLVTELPIVRDFNSLQP